MLGLFIIGCAALVSILGYLIRADKTPYANDQKLELYIREPGFNVRFLQETRNEPAVETSFFHTMLFGRNDPYAAYSFYDFKFKGPNILIEEYTGNTPNNGSWNAFNLADVVYALDLKQAVVFDSLQQKLFFYEINNPVRLS